MMEQLSTVSFFLIPILLIAFFIVSLVLFCKGKRAKKLDPDSITDKQMTTRRVLLIVSSVMAGLTLIGNIAFAALIYMAIAFM